jgi:cell division protein FtsZ
MLGLRNLLTTRSSLIQIHSEELRALLRDRHSENALAVLQAAGPNRSEEIAGKLLAHPMLDDGELLDQADAVLVSIVGGSDLTMAEINCVMERINERCESARLKMGAAIDDSIQDRMAVTVIASRKNSAPAETNPRQPANGRDLAAQLLNPQDPARPPSRFVPPMPALTPERVEQLLAGHQKKGASRPRKNPLRMRQTQLQLEIINKGRFDKSEPTIVKGEDLDVPTYIRRGVVLN